MAGVLANAVRRMGKVPGTSVWALFGATSVRMASTGAAQMAAPATSPGAWGVERTANNRMPVYRDIRNHLTRELTIIRKVHGDLEALRASILEDFDVTPKDVWCKVGRVEIKGAHVPVVKKWLMAKGF